MGGKEIEINIIYIYTYILYIKEDEREATAPVNCLTLH